jgi:hypothetical protein
VDHRRDDVRPVTATLVLLSLSAYFFAPDTAQGKTPARGGHYGAIAYHEASGSLGWSSERRTSREARIEALEQCGHEQCVVVMALTRSCAALARNSKKFFVEKGATRQEAETKALKKCGEGCEVAVWTCTR